MQTVLFLFHGKVESADKNSFCIALSGYRLMYFYNTVCYLSKACEVFWLIYCSSMYGTFLFDVSVNFAGLYDLDKKFNSQCVFSPY
jgi:hypothetical protein